MTLATVDRTSPSGAIVRTLRLVRPERRNALDPPLLSVLRAALFEAEGSSSVRALVVTGEGSAFCAGYDLTVPFSTDAPDGPVVETMQAVRLCPLPTVARVNGAAFGAGLELAVSCDLRVASTDARFCLPPARLGIAYAPEGLARLSTIVGSARARRLAFTGETIDAKTALAWGLVDACVPPSALDDETARLADELADNAPLAIRAMKKTLNRLEHALATDERAEAEAERLVCYRSEDLKSGLDAFRRREKARFTGR